MVTNVAPLRILTWTSAAALLFTACDRPVVAPERAAIDAAVTQSTMQHGTLTEPTAYNDRICTLHFPGTPSQTAQMFVIWNLGHGILDVPFDTPRPDLYAVLPGTMHTNPDHPELDHDHIVSAGPGVPGYDGTWDVWVVVPGPHFDRATYNPPRDVAAMFALINSGVLAGPFGFAQAGFGRDLVLRAPLTCN